MSESLTSSLTSSSDATSSPSSTASNVVMHAGEYAAKPASSPASVKGAAVSPTSKASTPVSASKPASNTSKPSSTSKSSTVSKAKVVASHTSSKTIYVNHSPTVSSIVYTDAPSKGVPTGAIIAAVVGGLIVLIALIFEFRRWRARLAARRDNGDGQRLPPRDPRSAALVQSIYGRPSTALEMGTADRGDLEPPPSLASRARAFMSGSRNSTSSSSRRGRAATLNPVRTGGLMNEKPSSSDDYADQPATPTSALDTPPAFPKEGRPVSWVSFNPSAPTLAGGRSSPMLPLSGNSQQHLLNHSNASGDPFVTESEINLAAATRSPTANLRGDEELPPRAAATSPSPSRLENQYSPTVTPAPYPNPRPSHDQNNGAGSELAYANGNSANSGPAVPQRMMSPTHVKSPSSLQSHSSNSNSRSSLSGASTPPSFPVPQVGPVPAPGPVPGPGNYDRRISGYGQQPPRSTSALSAHASMSRPMSSYSISSGAGGGGPMSVTSLRGRGAPHLPHIRAGVEIVLPAPLAPQVYGGPGGYNGNNSYSPQMMYQNPGSGPGSSTSLRRSTSRLSVASVAPATDAWADVLAGHHQPPPRLASTELDVAEQPQTTTKKRASSIVSVGRRSRANSRSSRPSSPVREPIPHPPQIPAPQQMPEPMLMSPTSGPGEYDEELPLPRRPWGQDGLDSPTASEGSSSIGDRDRDSGVSNG
ncbi:hypothetical protein DL93DRAFT_929334 [Clavulina sp. PMI_390]|nr:hypothetical protein DL93DRAFT_929334 [Clavulina sp. PMI_390]